MFGNAHIYSTPPLACINKTFTYMFSACDRQPYLIFSITIPKLMLNLTMTNLFSYSKMSLQKSEGEITFLVKSSNIPKEIHGNINPRESKFSRPYRLFKIYKTNVSKINMLNILRKYTVRTYSDVRNFVHFIGLRIINIDPKWFASQFQCYSPLY